MISKQLTFIAASFLAASMGFTNMVQARTQVDDSTGALLEDDAAPKTSRGNSPDNGVDAETVQSPEVKPVQNRTPASAEESPAVGPSAAQKYFRKNKSTRAVSRREPAAAAQGEAVSAEDHYLALGLGGFVSGDSYSWGATAHNTGSGRLVVELTYRIAPLSSLADWALRADYMGYEMPDGKATQLAISPVLMFPDSGSRFPLYFGIGAGPGIFLQQISQNSVVALNYQLFAGVRFFNVLESTGFFLETGLKNLVLLTSQGQFNGAFLTAGGVFTF